MMQIMCMPVNAANSSEKSVCRYGHVFHKVTEVPCKKIINLIEENYKDSV